MYKTITTLTVSAFLLQSPSFCASSSSMEQWETKGSFSEIIAYPGALLQRHFTVKPTCPESEIETISILGYKDGRVIISVKFKKERSDVLEELKSEDLLYSTQFNKVFYNEKNMPGFLSCFVDKGLIPDFVKDNILKKIETEKPCEEGLEKLARANELAKIKFDEIEEINKIGQPNITGSFTPAEAHHVLQGCVGYSNGTYPVIGTRGAGPCVILAVHNPTAKVAALCHIDARTNLSSLNSIFHHLGDRETKLHVHLSGGFRSSHDMIYNILKLLQNRSDIEVKSSLLMGRDDAIANLAIDARSGEIFTSFFPDQLKFCSNYDARMRICYLSALIENRPLHIEPDLKPQV